MMGEDVAERLTEEVLQELLDAPSLDEFIDAHEFPAVTLPEFLERMGLRTFSCTSYTG